MPVQSIQLSRYLFALAAIICLSACAEGQELSVQETRQWFPAAMPELKRVVVLLRTCQPSRASGYNTVWVDAASGGDELARCRFGSDAAIAEIQSALREVGVLGVRYSPSDGPKIPVSSATFILFREGLGVSGTSTTVEYYATPKPCVPTREGDESYSIESAPITGAPCRWFWQRDES